MLQESAKYLILPLLAQTRNATIDIDRPFFRPHIIGYLHRADTITRLPPGSMAPCTFRSSVGAPTPSVANVR